METLRTGRVLLMDGAMGTELRRAGLGDNECAEVWNLTRAETVLDVHRSYVRAGAQCLVTNTFQANASWLARFNFQDRLPAIVREGLRLARECCPPTGFVFASIGPADISAFGNLRDFATALDEADPHADAFLLETWSSPAVADLARRLHELRPSTLLAISFAFRRRSASAARFVLDQGEIGPEQAAKLAQTAGASIIGVNCGNEIDLEDMSQIVRSYRAVTSLPLLARPNAGTPKRAESGWIYPRGPAEMAAGVSDLLQAGVSLIGGCCGTTPGHIAAFESIVRQWTTTYRR
jgi:5-methyltetrahydrofolate--homocysteine methyltransferase